MWSVKQTDNISPSNEITPEAYSQLHREKEKLADENQKLQNEILFLKEELAQLKRLIYGSKSERYVKEAPDAHQGSLFDNDQIEKKQPEETIEEIKYKRTKPVKEKSRPLRAEIPSHLPREKQIIEPEGKDETAKKIGEEVSERLEYVPGKLFVREIVRPKYITKQNDEKTEISIAQLPSEIIPKGNVGPSLLAHIFISKFVDHLPFYRQSKMFARNGLNIPDSTMGGWFSEASKWLSFVYDELKHQVLSGDYLQADETPIPVLSKDKPGSTHKGYFWVYYDPLKRLVLFDYRKSRGRDGPEDILSDFKGYLQTDGYAGYENLKNQSNITRLACMAHARRKFEHALENDPERGEYALETIGHLYDIERRAKEEGLSYEQIYDLRQNEVVPILTEFEKWLKDEINQVLPKSAIGKAFAYTLKLWPYLKRYVENGKFQIDNNLIENSIRPVALGRKNYLFCGSHEAAQNAAMIYSFLGTCKINNIEPYRWLKETLEALPECKSSELSRLLPR